MANIIKFILIATCVVLVLTGCSGSSGPSTPGTESDPSDTSNSISDRNVTESANNHYCLLFNLIYIDATDPNSIEYEIVPLRATSMHLNILKFLEVGPCTDCFKIVGFNFPEPGVLDVNIEITHPFDDLNLTIFDVRGIMMFNGSHTFPESGLTCSDTSLGDGSLVNADGYTQLYNGSTLGQSGIFQTYYEGNFATETVPNAVLNGFKRYFSNDSGNTRNALYPADSKTKFYRLDLPSSEFVLGYAVDASWDIPDVDPVTDPMSDFPISANSPEPWKLVVQKFNVGSGLTPDGGEVLLQIDVYDWQGKESYAEPVVECAALFGGTNTANWTDDFDEFSRYQVTVGNLNLAPLGTYKCLIGVEDNTNDSSPEWLDLTAYQVFDLSVYDPDGGWVKTWGGTDWDGAGGIAIDGTGNILVGGGITYSADLDPGSGVDIHDHGWDTATLSKFDSYGNYIWGRSWGGGVYSGGVAVDTDGNIWAVGSFYEIVDFDPGEGVDNHTPIGSPDGYLSKFDPDGNFLWTRTWGGSDMTHSYGLDLDSSGNALVAGFFRETVDFDPGDGVDEHTSQGGQEPFLSKFDSDGNFLWANTWGGGSSDFCDGVAVDSIGNIYATGSFQFLADFDPGPDTDYHFSTGITDQDIFLSKFNSDGDYLWAKTWGGMEDDNGRGINTDHLDNIYVVGYFSATADFDPGVGVENHTSNGHVDSFLSKLTPDGDFIWARTWGGPDSDSSSSVDVDNNGNPFVSGVSYSVGGTGAFISKYDPDGLFLWDKNIFISGGGIVADDLGNVFLTGSFRGSKDFDPDSGDMRTSNGKNDAFFLKYLPDGTW